MHGHTSDNEVVSHSENTVLEKPLEDVRFWYDRTVNDDFVSNIRRTAIDT